MESMIDNSPLLVRISAAAIFAAPVAARATTPTNVALANPGFESPYVVVSGNNGRISGNIARLRHPELVGPCVSMGGAFDIHQFLNGYYDDNCYFNCPPDFLPNLTDEHYLSEYRNGMHLVLATGETDICLDDNVRLAGILDGKQIPHWLDVWGNGTGHDSPWCLRPV
jgi:esterase/lipase superfamily enzyme